MKRMRIFLYSIFKVDFETLLDVESDTTGIYINIKFNVQYDIKNKFDNSEDSDNEKKNTKKKSKKKKFDKLDK